MQFDKGSTDRARRLAERWLAEKLDTVRERISIGLPEYDGRFQRWRVPLHASNGRDMLVGEVAVDAQLTSIVETTDPNLIKKRVKKLNAMNTEKPRKRGSIFVPTAVPNKVVLGDSERVLEDFPPDTAQLVFTSPPYFNAKPEYSEYVDYQEYLDFIRRVIVRVHAILSDGRFFVINASPVLVRRTSRATSSKRIPIPFDLHRILDSAGFDFIDDIIWLKPEGAGWNLGRGRRFRADRQPLQYKPVPVTEYVLVYRKRTDRLIDWNLRKHHDQTLVEKSRIEGDYAVTNVWRIPPGHSKVHPAVFPDELAARIIRYYSFIDDLVLDPFAGTGTVGRVAYSLGRRFLLVDNEPSYYKCMKNVLTAAIPATTRIDFEIHDTFEQEHHED